MFKSLALSAALSLAVASSASAAVVFTDAFNYGSSSALNAADSVFAGNWATTGGSIDYLAAPPADFGGLCNGTAGCIDLDGSTGDAGLFSTVQSFAAGSYSLAVELFGSGRGTSESVTITLGSWTTTIANILAAADASGVFTFTTTGGALSFQNAGGDNIGAVLSGVTLSAVPLPAGGLLLIGALGGLAALRRRKLAA